MKRRKHPTSDEMWQEYFRKHFPELEDRYPLSRKTAKKNPVYLWHKLRSLWRQKRNALCKDCVFNTPQICPHPERPHAFECRDYKEGKKEKPQKI